MLSRRKLLAGSGLLLAAAGGGYWLMHSRMRSRSAPTGMVITDEELEKARALLERVVSADVHAHPGRSFVVNAENLGASLKVFTLGGAFEKESVADMRSGGLTMASFAIVSDFQLLGLGETGISAVREFEAGEAWRSYQTQMARLHAMVDEGWMMPVLVPGDVLKARERNRTGALITAEGGDFLAGSLANLDQAWQDGMRSMTIVHYHTNEIGDIQTVPAVHHGLTPFGRSLVKAMNSKGMLIDLAHASKPTAMQALDISERPVMISHTTIRGKNFDHPRFIDLDLARRVAAGGGIIGAWPAGIGLSSLSDYIDQILRLIDLVGVDHAALGTDMDANYKPVFDNYRQLPVLVGGLLKRGLAEDEAAKFLGGNFMRVFSEVTTGAE